MPDKHDPAGWLASEKLDGVRAIWNGHTFLTRTAVQIFAPSWFTRGLPSHILDGELFMGRGHFQATSGAVRRNDVDHPHWKTLKYHIFDAPHAVGDLYERLREAYRLTGDCPRTTVVEQTVVKDRDHLSDMLKTVLDGGGEGLIIRRPSANWVAIRSHDMLKVKIQDETDAQVFGHQGGEGKHTGRLGALLCRLIGDPKIHFAVGTGLSDHDRENPPGLGLVIRVGHHGFTDAGIPRFPSFLGVRAEQPWSKA